MTTKRPPSAVDKKTNAPIADMRDAFARKTPETEEDRTAARAFIEAKIGLIRGDPRMTDAEKAEAIADIKRRLQGL